MKGDTLSIKIREEVYQAGLKGCKNNRHGRLLLSKGDSSIKCNDLHAKLSLLWKPLGQWRMVPLEIGLYEFSFSLIEDLQNVWSVGNWTLNPGVLQLFCCFCCRKTVQEQILSILSYLVFNNYEF